MQSRQLGVHARTTDRRFCRRSAAWRRAVPGGADGTHRGQYLPPTFGVNRQRAIIQSAAGRSADPAANVTGILRRAALSARDLAHYQHHNNIDSNSCCSWEWVEWRCGCGDGSWRRSNALGAKLRTHNITTARLTALGGGEGYDMCQRKILDPNSQSAVS